MRTKASKMPKSLILGIGNRNGESKGRDVARELRNMNPFGEFSDYVFYRWMKIVFYK